MLECDFGVPGSGKSYKAVYTIYETFLNDKSDRYGKKDLFYTNIHEFKFDRFPNKGFPFVPNTLISQLSQLRLLDIQGKSKDEIIELARSMNLFNCLIVWDESQTFFSKKNDVLLWWVEFHRHLHHDIILIAQVPRRILSEYKENGDLFFKAVPPSLRTTNSLKYKRYGTFNMYKGEVIDTISLKPDPNIFALYKSGANEKPKKVIYKFVFLALFFAFVVFSIFAYVTSSMGSDSNSTSSDSSSSVRSVVDPTLGTVTVACVGFDCSYLGQSVSLADLNVKQKEFGVYPLTTLQISEGVFLREYPNHVDFIKGVFNVSLSVSDSD